MYCTPTHSLRVRYEYNCTLLFNYREKKKNLTCKMMGLEGTTALFLVFLCFFQFSPFFFHPRFSDYVSWAPLRSDDKQNFHVLCIINPSLPLFMPTLPLSRAHA